MSAAVLPARPDERPAERRGLRLRGVSWLVWRQNRVALTVVTFAFAALIGFLLHERFQLDVANARLQSMSCGGVQVDAACGRAEYDVYQVAAIWHQLLYLALALPGLLGALLAAQPLAADLERGRHLLLWSQSVSPRRWFGYRLGLPAAVLLVLSTVLSLVARWGGYWSHPRPALSYWASGSDFHDLAPVYPVLTLTAFALGGLAGLVIQRAIPALVVTLTLYGGLIWGLVELRPFLAPFHSRVIPPGVDYTTTDWAVSDGPVLNGRWASSYAECPNYDCSKVPTWERYHPISQFGPLLWAETAVLAVVAAILITLAYRRLRALTR